MTMQIQLLVSSAVCLFGVSNALAGFVSSSTLGSGENSAWLQFDFDNGHAHHVTVHWDGALDGFQALSMVAAELDGGQLQYQSFSFGKFVTGIGIYGDYNNGEGDLWPIENFWHYWTADGNGEWVSSMIGSDSRQLVDGSRDAWVFGSNAAPQSVPSAGSVLVIGLAAMRRRRTESQIARSTN